MMEAARIVITGGGTGGHVFPGLALAAALGRKSPTVRVLYIGTGKRLEARLVPAAGVPFKSIVARGLVGMGIARMVSGALLIPIGLVQALYHMVRFWPGLVVGMGGYVAGPVVTAAWILRRKVAIHEQNLTPGLTTRMLSRLADLVMVSYPETGSSFHRVPVVVTGNPVREVAIGKKRVEKNTDKFRLLVLGGSQGSRNLNRMMIRAMELIGPGRMNIVHQTGLADESYVKEAYEKIKVEAEVVPFIENIGCRYHWADIVVCRAGATTLAELAVNNSVAVLVPFPGAAGGHQDENARYLVEKGAAFRVQDGREESGKDLAEALLRLKDDLKLRQSLSKAISKIARPEAGKDMACACLSLMGKD